MRFELAVRKFLAFERAMGKSEQLIRYCELIRDSMTAGFVQARDPADLLLLRRLAQTGLLRQHREITDSENGRRTVRTVYSALQIQQVDGHQGTAPRWLFDVFGGQEILRFFAMKSAGIEWIIRDLEQQVQDGRTSETRSVQNRVAVNTMILSEIWRISLHYELTESHDDDAAGLSNEIDPADETATTAQTTQTAVFKEKIRLAKMPNIHQLRHIKATCHYHRNSLAGIR